MLLLNSFCPLALDMLPCRTVAFIRHKTSSAAYRCWWLTHIIAGAIEIVSTVHSDVNRMHLSPAVRCTGFGEVTWRGGEREEIEKKGQSQPLSGFIFFHLHKKGSKLVQLCVKLTPQTTRNLETQGETCITHKRLL